MRLPSSPAQRRLWFLDRLHPGTSLYNVPLVLRLAGPLDVEALAAALDGVAARHDVLRARFPAEARGEAMEIEAHARLALPVDDVPGDPTAVRRAIADEVWRPFALDEAPLARARLLRLADDDHVLALTLHHSVFDGGSEDVLLDDLSRLYTAEVLGAGPPAPPAVQYADFVEAQHRHGETGRLAADLEAWRRRLDGAPALLDLPVDRPRSADGARRGGVHLSALPAATWEAVARAGREWRTTPFVTLLAAFGALLARYGGSTDLVVGTPAAARTRPEWEALVGLFANTVPLRLDLSGRPGLRELARRVRATVLEAYERQATPFELLVEAVRPDRSLGHNPLFQVLFACATGPRRLPRLPGVRVTAVDPGSPTAKFDLSLSFEPRAGGGAGAAGRLEYAADLFDRVTAVRLVRHYRRLLEGALARPDAPVDELPLLDEDERSVLVAWGSGPAEEPVTSPARLFREQALRTPDAPALRCAGEVLTYRQLAARVDATARALAALGVGPEVRAGIVLDRSPDLMVAMLAVLEAGGAYVPVDPAYPRARVEHMLGDSAVSLVLTEPRHRAALPATGARAVLMDELAGGAGAPVAEPHGANLAYVIYTSGSTGTPKGVAVTHEALAGLLVAMRDLLGVGEGERWGAVASVSFDGAIEELLLPLVTGGCLLLYEAPLSRDPAELVRRFERDGVTVVHATPSLWRLLVDRGWPRAPITAALSGGEPLPPALAARLRAAAAVWNVYGPTETTVAADVTRVDDGGVTFGPPLAGVRLQVVDAGGEPVPAGVAGELCIAGRGLARGYLGRPGLTAERFVPDPLSPVPGGRRYRSGDLARYRGDGRLELRGRADHQVKVRGFRVELGEVEAVLAGQPGVTAAAATVSDGSRLVGYVAGEVDVTEVRRALRERLPEHLVPSAIVALPRLPLTPSGKVDRRALPPPQAPAAGTARLAPRTGVEDAIAGIWRSALGVADVGIDDNFFDVGGHSLLLVAVQGELTRAFQVEVPLTVLFQRPTVRALAEHLGPGGAAAPALDGRRQRGLARREAAAGQGMRARRREG